MSRMQHDEAQSATDDLKNKAREVQQNLRDLGGSAKAAAAEAYGTVRESAADYVQQGKQRAARWEHDLEDAIQARPVRSLLIAAGAGMLLGLLWRRH